MKKVIYISIGFIFIFLGALGVALPFLPTTPFLLVAAFCFARGSGRFYKWFMGTKLYKKYLGEYVKSRGMTSATKIRVLITVTFLILIGCILTRSIHAKIAMAAVLAGHYYYFWFKMKTLPSDKPVSAQRRLLKMLGKAKRYVVQTVLLRWLALICNVTIIGSISLILQAAYDRRLDAFGLLETGIIFLISVFVRYVCIRWSTKASYRAATEAKNTLRNKLYGKLLSLGLSYRESVSSAAFMQMFVEGVENLQVYFSGYLPQLCYSVLAPVTLFITFAFIHLKVALILLACVPLIPLTILAIRKTAGKMMKRHWGQYTDIGKSYLESLQGLTTLKIFNADEKRHRDMNESAEGFRKTTMRVLRMQLGSVTVMDLLAYGGSALGIWAAISEVAAGRMPLWAGVCFVLLSSEFFLPLRMLGSFFHSSMSGTAAAEQMFSLLDIAEPEQKSGKIVGPDIVVSGCGFEYGKERTALRDITASIPPSSFVAVVGESGCGKSTLAKILTGELKGYTGSVKIGGVELSEISESSIAKHISLSEHNSYIFKGTVADNLLFGCPRATQEDMLNVLKKVKLYDFVMSGGGLSMQISERGANLSGGQRQRLAIARAILHDADIYIFDEATSGVDLENEACILETLENMSGQKTVVLITHRMKLAVRAGKILVLKNGKASGFGSYSELYGRNPYYTELFDAQCTLESFLEPEKEETTCLKTASW